MHPSWITLQLYADGLIAKSCKIGDVRDESTLKEVFIEDVDLSIRHSLRIYCATYPQASLTDTEF